MNGKLVKIAPPEKRYIPYIKGGSEDVEDRLKSDFSDTLNKDTEQVGGIALALNNAYVVGVPYSISDRKLIMGPYCSFFGKKPPKDLKKKKLYIPLEEILAYQRFELPGVYRISGSSYKINTRNIVQSI
ncbi:hypothetical protein HYW75_06735 [Candidatus Pacearchaeota archaeon]|nr:hypothetical protein [Candidatus Pacearchaeota archaeon]